MSNLIPSPCKLQPYETLYQNQLFCWFANPKLILIEKLRYIALHPESHLHVINILENFISLFLEHIIKEEQLLRQYLPTKIVDQHIEKHQSELTLLDENLAQLKIELSMHNIQHVVTQLNQEFDKHVNQYDAAILKKLQLIKD